MIVYRVTHKTMTTNIVVMISDIECDELLILSGKAVFFKDGTIIRVEANFERIIKVE